MDAAKINKIGAYVLTVRNMEKIKKRLMQRLMPFMNRDSGKYLRAVSLQCCLQSSFSVVFTPVLLLLQRLESLIIKIQRII